MPRGPRCALLLTFCAVCLATAPLAVARDTITGVCPDGSVFIVQSAADIPCRDARQVEPEEVPPLKPQMLPRPYAWEVFRKQQDPNNPYNLVEAARRVRESGQVDEEGGPAVDASAAAESIQEPPEAPQTALLHAPQPPAPAPLPDFSEQEVRDLLLIVELTQQRAPATFEPEADRAVQVRVAHSPAFGARWREAETRRGRPVQGPVLLFSAVARAESRFHAHLTFVQGHQAFQPDPGDPGQLGVIHGALGALAPDETVLGYVVLPGHIDPTRPMDIYWNDRRLTATLRP